MRNNFCSILHFSQDKQKMSTNITRTISKMGKGDDHFVQESKERSIHLEAMIVHALINIEWSYVDLP